MDATWKTALWQQFGAALAMLENALDACPEDLWSDRSRKPEFWYNAYHCLFWLDLYLSGSREGFAPPAPYTLDELDPKGLLPDRVYTRDELRIYLAHGRKKCRDAIEALTDESLNQRCGFPWIDGSVAELFLYNLRHVQHHVGQLNTLLRQAVDAVPSWVRKADSPQSN